MWTLVYISFFSEKGRMVKKDEKKRKNEGWVVVYRFFRYGSPVRLLTPTAYPLGNSQGVPLFGWCLLKK
jgi:hypothetical protein